MADPVYIVTLNDGNTPFYTLRVTLDGVDYQLKFAWSVRESRWYLSIYDTSENAICGPLKIVCNYPLLKYYHSRELCPTGELIAVTLSSDDSPPGLTDLGVDRRVSLVYVPAE